MQGKVVKRHEVDWSRANCRGLATDFFYLEEEFLLKKELSISQIRKVCFACPIWRDCLEVGFAEERWGMWGGVTSYERNEIIRGNTELRINSLRRDLEEVGVPFEEIIEASLVEKDYL
jgi:hypothetical protein